MTKEIEENYKTGDWLVKHTPTGKVHSVHNNAKNALKKMKYLNDKHLNDKANSDTDDDFYESPYHAILASSHYKTNESVESVDEAYSEKNPKIDLHHKETGEYLTSTNWSPTIKHAISTFEQKYPDMVGKVKGYKAKTNESVDEAPKGTLVSEMIESILGDELVESTKQLKSILSEKFSEKLDEVKRTISKSILSKEDRLYC